MRASETALSNGEALALGTRHIQAVVCLQRRRVGAQQGRQLTQGLCTLGRAGLGHGRAGHTGLHTQGPNELVDGNGIHAPIVGRGRFICRARLPADRPDPAAGPVG